MVARKAIFMLLKSQQHSSVSVEKVHQTGTNPTASGATIIKVDGNRSTHELLDHPGGG